MTDPLTPDLDDIESKVKLGATFAGHLLLPGATVLALVAECRELRRLRGALAFLKGHAAADAYMAFAKALGWKEGT